MIGCRTINQKNLQDYKRMTAYIMDHNYHHGFNNILVFDIGTAPDSVVKKFMDDKHIISIQSIGKIDVPEEYKEKYLPEFHDSSIEYHFIFIPVFGKRKELHFDFSSSPPAETHKVKGAKKVVLEKGIYYVKY